MYSGHERKATRPILLEVERLHAPMPQVSYKYEYEVDHQFGVAVLTAGILEVVDWYAYDAANRQGIMDT